MTTHTKSIYAGAPMSFVFKVKLWLIGIQWKQLAAKSKAAAHPLYSTQQNATTTKTVNHHHVDPGEDEARHRDNSADGHRVAETN
jgi:hypothetical protein